LETQFAVWHMQWLRPVKTDKIRTQMILTDCLGLFFCPEIASNF
jgi:hypothetical protein